MLCQEFLAGEHAPERGDRHTAGTATRLQIVGAVANVDALIRRNAEKLAAVQHRRRVGLVRGDIYITNVVKFRPTKTGATGRLSNRPPTREEIALFRPWLMAEIARVNPGVIATLGNVPLQAVTDSRITIGEAHGRLTAAGETGRPLFPLYHPASLIYNRALAPVYEQDVRALADMLRKNAF